MHKKLYKVAASDTQYRFRVNILMWPNRTLLFGPLDHLGLHSMGSVAINIGLYESFFIRTQDGTYQPYRCAVIPAGCLHEIVSSGNIVASLIIEQDSPGFHHFNTPRLSNPTSLQHSSGLKWIECLRIIHEQKPTKDEIEQLLNQLLDTYTQTENNIDPRIENIVRTIQKDSYTNFSQEDLAASEGLSSSRFRHLFRDQLNITYRHYKVWRKVISALTKLHKVDNLTHAAMEAGFTDSAHLNRCFRNTLGVNPSRIFKNIDRFEI